MKLNHQLNYTTHLLILCVGICTCLHAQNPKDTTAASDSALLKQIEQQMQSAPAEQQQPSGTQTRSSLSFNPDIGVIGDFQGS